MRWCYLEAAPAGITRTTRGTECKLVNRGCIPRVHSYATRCQEGRSVTLSHELTRTGRVGAQRELTGIGAVIVRREGRVTLGFLHPARITGVGLVELVGHVGGSESGGGDEEDESENRFHCGGTGHGWGGMFVCSGVWSKGNVLPTV